MTTNTAATRQPDGVTESLLVRVHPGLCEGWGECHRWAPQVYPLDEDGCIDLHRLRVPPELAVSAWQGAQACPAGVISIVGIVVDPADAASADAASANPPGGSGASPDGGHGRRS